MQHYTHCMCVMFPVRPCNHIRLRVVWFGLVGRRWLSGSRAWHQAEAALSYTGHATQHTDDNLTTTTPVTITHNVVLKRSKQAEWNREILHCTAVQQLIHHYHRHHTSYNEVNYITWYTVCSRLLKHDTIDDDVYSAYCSELLDVLRSGTVHSRGLVDVLHCVANIHQYRPHNIHAELQQVCVSKLLQLLASKHTLERQNYVRCLAALYRYNRGGTLDNQSATLVSKLARHMYTIVKHVQTLPNNLLICNISCKLYRMMHTSSQRQHMIYLMNDMTELIANNIQQCTPHDIAVLLEHLNDLDASLLDLSALHTAVCTHLNTVQPAADMPLLTVERIVNQLPATHRKQLDVLCARLQDFVLSSQKRVLNDVILAIRIQRICAAYPHRFYHRMHRETASRLSIHSVQYTVECILLFASAYQHHTSRVLYNDYQRLQNMLLLQLLKHDLSSVHTDTLHQLHHIFIVTDIVFPVYKSQLVIALQQRGIHIDTDRIASHQPNTPNTALEPVRQLVSTETDQYWDKRKLFIETIPWTEMQVPTYTGAECIVLLHNMEQYRLMNDDCINNLFKLCYDQLMVRLDELNSAQVTYMLQYCLYTNKYTYMQFDTLIELLAVRLTQYDIPTLSHIMYYTAQFNKWKSDTYDRYVENVLEYIRIHEPADQLHLYTDHINVLLLGCANLCLRPVQLVQALIHNTSTRLQQETRALTDAQLNCLCNTVQQLVFGVRMYDDALLQQIVRYVLQPAVWPEVDLHQTAVLADILAELNINHTTFWQHCTQRIADDVSDATINGYVSLCASIHSVTPHNVDDTALYKRTHQYARYLNDTSAIKLYHLSLYRNTPLHRLPAHVLHQYCTQFYEDYMETAVTEVLDALRVSVRYNVYDGRTQMFYQYYTGAIPCEYLVDTEEDAIELVQAAPTDTVEVIMQIQLHSKHKNHYNMRTHTYQTLVYRSEELAEQYRDQHGIYTCTIDMDAFHACTTQRGRLQYVKQCLVNAIQARANKVYRFGDS